MGFFLFMYVHALATGKAISKGLVSIGCECDEIHK